MQIGILGSGLMGGKLGTVFASAGHGVVFSYGRSGDADPRRGFRPGGRWAATDRSAYGAVRVACGTTRVRDRRRSRVGVPFRASREVGKGETGLRWRAVALRAPARSGMNRSIY